MPLVIFNCHSPFKYAPQNFMSHFCIYFDLFVHSFCNIIVIFNDDLRTSVQFRLFVSTLLLFPLYKNTDFNSVDHRLIIVWSAGNTQHKLPVVVVALSFLYQTCHLLLISPVVILTVTTCCTTTITTTTTTNFIFSAVTRNVQLKYL